LKTKSLTLSRNENRVRRRKILVVDDEADLCKLVAHHLQKEGFEPVCVGNGTEALKAVATTGLIGDPRHDDARIRRSPSLPKSVAPNKEITSLPFLFLTDKVVGLELGADDYVTKPLRLREKLPLLAAAVETVPSFGYKLIGEE
jgi:CheY-like chemotaxis protein